jgi:hypothetical protein
MEDIVAGRRCTWRPVVLFGLAVGISGDLGVSAIQISGAPALAIVRVTVIDGTGAPAKADQAVVVSGNRLVAVGAFSTVTIPQAAQIIDGRGRFLIPGLWDAHLHTRFDGVDSLRLLVANGATSGRNMSAPWDYLPELLRARHEVSTGERVGPRLLTSGPLVDGPSAGRAPKILVSTPEEGRQAVRDVKARGADFVKVYNLLNRDSYIAIAGEAKAQGISFEGHVPFSMGAAEASDLGQRSIEHMEAILISSSSQEHQLRTMARDFRPGPVPTAGPVSPKMLFDTFSVPKLRTLAQRLKANHTVVVPTLTVSWNRVELRRSGSVIDSVDRVQYIPPAYVDAWRQNQALLSQDEERLDLEQRLVAVRELNRAGVTLLAGTDTMSGPFLLPGFSLHDELVLLVKVGLSEMQALQAATRNPARAFHLMDQGTIERGMRADLVLLDANPLMNIENVRKIRTVIANGRVFGRNELDAMLTDIQKDARDWKGTPTR